jgi:hypothetical protein
MNDNKGKKTTIRCYLEWSILWFENKTTARKTREGKTLYLILSKDKRQGKKS